MTRLYELTDDPRLTDAVWMVLRMLANCHPAGRDHAEHCRTLASAIVKFVPEARAVFLCEAPASLLAEVNDQLRELAKLHRV